MRMRARLRAVFEAGERPEGFYSMPGVLRQGTKARKGRWKISCYTSLLVTG